LVSVWEQLHRLGRQIDRDSTEVPTWDGRLGAAVFAAMALARLHYEETWDLVAKEIRARWRYDGDLRQPAWVDERSADYDDFRKIKSMMEEEERQLGAAPHLAGLTARNIDLDRFYRNWALGLLLGLEGTAPASRHEQGRIDALVAIAQRAQDADGSFYPR